MCECVFYSQPPTVLIRQMKLANCTMIFGWVNRSGGGVDLPKYINVKIYKAWERSVSLFPCLIVSQFGKKKSLHFITRLPNKQVCYIEHNRISHSLSKSSSSTCRLTTSSWWSTVPPCLISCLTISTWPSEAARWRAVWPL